MKHRIDAIDLEKLTYSYAVIDGDAALEKVDSISHEIKFEATEEGGCKTKNVSKYHPKEGVDVKEEDFKAAREEGLALLKVVDAYLVANPEAYAEGTINSGESVTIYSCHAEGNIGNLRHPLQLGLALIFTNVKVLSSVLRLRNKNLKVFIKKNLINTHCCD